MYGSKIGNNTRLVLALGAAVLLLASVVATAGFQFVIVVAADHGGNSFDLVDIKSGNFIINYIYEVEFENNDGPKLELQDDTVSQGESFVANGTNFDANATADLSIFHEQLLSLMEDGETAERSAAVLLTKSMHTISEDGEDLVIKNSDDLMTAETDDDGAVMLVTNISPVDVSSEEYDISLECEAGPDGDAMSASFNDPLVVDNSTSKQFFELSLPAGGYEQCQVVMSPTDEDDPAFKSSMASLTVMAESGSEISTASINGTTDSAGSFMQNVIVASDADTGRYVLMSETSNSTDDGKKAIAPLTIIDDDETSTAGTDDSSSSNDDLNSSNDAGTPDTNSPPDAGGSNGGDNGNGITPPDDSGSEGPPAPGNGGDEEIDPCQDVVSDSGNVNNAIVQSSSQSASNSYSDNDVIDVVQKIHGTYNGTGHLNTRISIDDSDTVNQAISQNVNQNAIIKKCPGESEGGSNQTNTIDMNATQLAANAYSDNTTVIIVQTIIIPKYCNTDVNAPISISDSDKVTQSIDQSVDQNGKIAYGGSGSGSNTVNQVSMQVARNNATNDEVITINQVIIVPPDCPVEIHAPIVVEGNDDVQMSVVQNAEQDAAVNSGAGGVTIMSSVSGGDQAYTTNTIVTVASQDGQNSFSDNDTIIIEQDVYYVNDTAGLTEENYEENLADEFGNSTTGDTSNSTLPAANSTLPAANSTLPAANSTLPAANSTMTEVGGDNSTSSEDSDGIVTPAIPIDSAEEDVVIEDSDNSTDDTETFVVVEESDYSEPAVEEDAGGEGQPTQDNSTASVDSGESLSADPPAEVAEESSSEPPPETDTTTEPEAITSDPVDNSDTTTGDAPSEPPAPEETPPAETNTTETTDTAGATQDPAPVDNQETSTISGNSTSTA
jgi:hypothetical protein